MGFVGNVKRGAFDELGIHNQISKILNLLVDSRKPQNLPLRVIQELKKLAVDVEVASVPSQEVENGRRVYLLKTIIELSTILWQDGSCQGELGK